MGETTRQHISAASLEWLAKQIVGNWKTATKLPRMKSSNNHNQLTVKPQPFADFTQTLASLLFL